MQSYLSDSTRSGSFGRDVVEWGGVAGRDLESCSDDRWWPTGVFGVSDPWRRYVRDELPSPVCPPTV